MQTLTIVLLGLFALFHLLMWDAPYASRRHPDRTFVLFPVGLQELVFLLAAFITSHWIESPTWWLSPRAIGYGGMTIYVLAWVHLIVMVRWRERRDADAP